MKKFLLMILSVSVLFSGCQTVTTDMVAVDSITDIGDSWNDTDSRLVADEMIDDVLKGGWLKHYYRKNGDKNPTVIVGRVKDRTMEDLNSEIFIHNLQIALVNSGMVDFVANASERIEVRGEREGQASYASEETANFDGEEIGADYMLKGEVNRLVNRDGKKAVKFYQVNLTLINVETNKKVWIGEKKIKKLISS